MEPLRVRDADSVTVLNAPFLCLALFPVIYLSDKYLQLETQRKTNKLKENQSHVSAFKARPFYHLDLETTDEK